MNKTRKAIIELIEPFMNKTLSEGCLFIDDILYGGGNSYKTIEIQGKGFDDYKYGYIDMISDNLFCDNTDELEYFLNQDFIKSLNLDISKITKKELIELRNKIILENENKGVPNTGVDTAGPSRGSKEYFKNKLEGISKSTYSVRICYIIGHYEMTAIEKFLHKNFSGEIDFDLDYIYLYPSQTLSLSLNKEELKIPFKLLHLYTEQEEKDLLELLKKLGN